MKPIRPRKGTHLDNADTARKASATLDELLWVLQRLKFDHIKLASNLLRDISLELENTSIVARGYQFRDPNKHFLIGVLPRLFQDRELFPQNEDISDFAASALGLAMNRAEKRSRYEIIGKVVCETDQLDEQRLTALVTVLERLVGNSEELAHMIEKKKAGSFSWNETIQELLRRQS